VSSEGQRGLVELGPPLRPFAVPRHSIYRLGLRSWRRPETGSLSKSELTQKNRFHAGSLCAMTAPDVTGNPTQSHTLGDKVKSTCDPTGAKRRLYWPLTAADR